jgi:hypothetical protein
MLPNWPKVEVDEAQCRRWMRQSRYRAIGLRVEPPLLVLDIDVPDPRAAVAVRNLVPRAAQDGLIRIGAPPKVAYFLRLAEAGEPFREAHTRKFAIGDTKVQVQAFAGGGGGAQFGAFGPHSHDKVTGDVLRTYHWLDGRSPATVRLDALPELPRGRVMDFLDAADDLLAAWPGAAPVLGSARGEVLQDQCYDLREDQVFTDAEGFEYSLDELTAEAKARRELKQPNLRLRAWDDPSSSGSPRCKVHWSRDRGLAIVDFATNKTHHPEIRIEDPVLFAEFEAIIGKAKS